MGNGAGEQVLITCEHGGNRIPAELEHLFAGAEAVLASHRGRDIGALPVARRLADELDAPLIAADISRLVCDLNRSPGHPALFSEYTRGLPPQQRREILARHYAPHRTRVEDFVASHRDVLHIAVHSFTPDWRGTRRNADVGLLYDPRRPAERLFCLRWQRALDELRVRRNYPYRGTADGLTTMLRRRYGSRYLGIEVELNQALFQSGAAVGAALAASLRHTIAAAALS